MYNPSATVWLVNGYSVRVLHASDSEEDVGNVFPNFFDHDFSVAASTGFTRVWEGSMIFRDFLEKFQRRRRVGGAPRRAHEEGSSLSNHARSTNANGDLDAAGKEAATAPPSSGISSATVSSEESSDTASAFYCDLDLCFDGKNCIELGSGCGMFGLHLAALGANVLLSDVPSVTKDSTMLNVKLNSIGDVPEGTFFSPDVEAVYIGDGTASATPIDWFKPLSETVKAACKKVNYLIGCECVWVPDILSPFAHTMACLLAEAPTAARALVCYPVRGGRTAGKSYFTTQKQFEDACVAEGLVLAMLQFTPRDMTNSESLDTCIYSIGLREEAREAFVELNATQGGGVFSSTVSA